jgi:hypothetical protein
MRNTPSDRPPDPQLSDSPPSPDAIAADPHYQRLIRGVLLKHERETLDAFIEQMEIERHEVFLLVDLEEMTLRQAAEALDIPKTTAQAGCGLGAGGSASCSTGRRPGASRELAVDFPQYCDAGDPANPALGKGCADESLYYYALDTERAGRSRASRRCSSESAKRSKKPCDASASTRTLVSAPARLTDTSTSAVIRGRPWTTTA